MTGKYTASIETELGTYQHGFHLGSFESMARTIVEHMAKEKPRLGRGTRIVTIGLKLDGKLVDTYDGTDWFSQIVDTSYEDEAQRLQDGSEEGA